MARKTLIMQNLGILDYFRRSIKMQRVTMITFRLQRCCYQVFSDHIPACLFYQRIPRSLAWELSFVPSPLRGEG